MPCGVAPGRIPREARWFWYPRLLLLVLLHDALVGLRAGVNLILQRVCLANHIVKEYEAYHRVEIELVREMLCVAIFGLVGLVKMNPQIEDDVLMKAIEQTLRLDMAPIEAGEG